MLACGGCAVLKLKYKLHGRGDENGTAYTAIFFNGSTRGKYYKSLGSAAYYAAYFKQADEAAGTGVTCADLLGVPLITPARLYVQKEISNWLGADINKLNVLATVNMMTHAAMFINSGIACGLTIEGAVDLFEDDKLAFRPLEPELAFISVLAWKRFQPVGNAAAKFLEYIKIMQKAHTKNAPYKTVQCVKKAYQSIFFKYNFAVFKGFYAR